MDVAKNGVFQTKLKEGLPLDFRYIARISYPGLEAHEAMQATMSLYETDASGRPTKKGESQIESNILRNPVLRPTLYASKDDIHSSEHVPQFWFDDMRKQRPVLSEVLDGVGRLESRNLERDYGQGETTLGMSHGTGFMISPGVVLTNRHVAKWFVDEKTGTIKNSKTDGRPAKVYINFDATINGSSTSIFEIKKVLYFAQEDGPDAALLELHDAKGAPAPVPVSFEPVTGEDYRKVAVCGVPHVSFKDIRFMQTANVKRVSPGFMTGTWINEKRLAIQHDCTTGAGNSGSPLVDLSSGKVIGLHLAGGQKNSAEPLSELLREKEISEILGKASQGVAPLPLNSVSQTPRPSIPVDDFDKMAELLLPWNDDGEVDKIAQRTAGSVGLIEVENHPQGFSTVGSAFLVGKNHVVTTRYIAETLPSLGPPNQQPNQKGVDSKPVRAFIQFGSTIEGAPETRHEILAIKHVEELPANGIAILEIANSDLRPLPLATERVSNPGDTVMVIGFPLSGGRGEPEVENLVFGDAFGLRSVSPGRVIPPRENPDETLLWHDCSTTAGFGGAPLIDVRTGQVIGVHMGGMYLVGNFSRVISESLNNMIREFVPIE